MSAVDGDEATLAECFGEAVHNVLLLAPPMDACAEDGCVDLLTRRAPADEDVLYVTFVQSPDERLDAWGARMGDDRPASVGFVDVGDPSRSAAAAGRTDGGPGSPVSVQSVSSPGNLTDLGIKISDFLTDWEADGRHTAVCFHSLTTLLQYADVQRAFRFLHVLTGRVRSIDGSAHYHMDPSAHEEQTVNTLTTLFDGVASWEDGRWSVRNR